jgi:photosystem II stability/assembly factor-like uncharacterized protein
MNALSRVLTVVTCVTSALLLAPAAVAAAVPADHPSPGRGLSWELSPTGSDARLRGLAAVSRRVAWTSGSEGTVLRTVDGGRSWQDVSPPDTAELQFRDIEAFDARHAVALSIGEGEDSRIYVTSDGGRTWTLAFRNDDPAAFYDCAAFFDRRRGLALSDPVGGTFRIAATEDGGRTWEVLDDARMPPALAGEFAFAASGTCLVTSGPRDAWFATGGVDPARVFHSRDGGRSWSVVATPVLGGPSAGIYSLAFRSPWRGLAVGGDFALPDQATANAATTWTGGRTWTLASGLPGGYRSGSAWVPWTWATALAVGPTGSDVSTDGGRTWRTFDTGSFDSVDCAWDGACWASGETGRVAVLHR